MRWPKRVTSLHYLIIGVWLCSVILTVRLYSNLTSATEGNQPLLQNKQVEVGEDFKAEEAKPQADKIDDDAHGFFKRGKRPAEDAVSSVERVTTERGEFPYDVKPDDPKLDWHDEAAIARDRARTGPGEQGHPVDPKQLGNKPEQDQLFAANGFNGFVSDAIALDRAVPDIRHPQCRQLKHSARLPTVSVVIPFYDEHLSTLLRTVHSVVKQSPRELLAEVILSDDGSTKAFLKDELEHYISERFAVDEAEGRRKNQTVVRIVRAARRAGLIRARLAGARIATGDVLLFLDSHCEASVNWLPPLLEPIALDYRTVTCPFIDVIDFDTFAYRAQDEGARGAFDWQFFYKRLPLTDDDLKHPTRPFDNPVMAGGLFAISKRWFDELGRYDPDLLIWGGEQYELSFKVWQCGGRLVDVPCSRVGHIYRKFSPFPVSSEFGDFASRNYKRVAEVWMDDWKEYLYKRMPNVRLAQPGDLTQQLAVRQRLKCKSFDWFMKEVAFDLQKHYPAVEPEPYAKGTIQLQDSQFCIDSHFGEAMQSLELSKCGRGEQHFQITYHHDIRLTGGRDTFCFDVPQHVPDASIVLYSCHNAEGNQLFKYDLQNSQLFHPASRMCVDADVVKNRVRMMPCDKNADGQRWTLQNMNRPALQELWRYKSQAL